jgi:hypothetical protein
VGLQGERAPAVEPDDLVDAVAEEEGAVVRRDADIRPGQVRPVEVGDVVGRGAQGGVGGKRRG